MPAAVWRTRPARSISRGETICASVGLSRRVCKKNWVERMWLGILEETLLWTIGLAAEFVEGLWAGGGGVAPPPALLIRQLLPAQIGQGRLLRVGELMAVEIDPIALDRDRADLGLGGTEHGIGGDVVLVLDEEFDRNDDRLRKP